SIEHAKLLLVERLRGVVSSKAPLSRLSGHFQSVLEPYARLLSIMGGANTLLSSSGTGSRENGSSGGQGRGGGGQKNAGVSAGTVVDGGSGRLKGRHRLLPEEHNQDLILKAFRQTLEKRLGVGARPGLGKDATVGGSGGVLGESRESCVGGEPVKVRGVVCPRGEVVLLQSEIFAGLFLRLIGPRPG
ncbi:unnamed protein product, partial [Discosporangium mesarthrocarpum]